MESQCIHKHQLKIHKVFLLKHLIILCKLQVVVYQ